MHENEVQFAIKRALRRHFPELESTQEGRKKLDEISLDIVTAIRETGIKFVNARGQ